MTFKSSLATSCSLLVVPTCAFAASPAPIVCPEAILPSSVQIVDVAAGWTPYVASPLYLHAAAPMYGPPEMRGDLADFKEQRGKHEWSYTYQLDGDFLEGKWLQCAYGEHNQLTLSRRLPDETRECKITYRKGTKAGQHQIQIRCIGPATE